MAAAISLYKKNDELYAHVDGAEDKPVTVVWLRPLSGRGAEVSIRGEQDEIATLNGLDELDPQSRALAEESLGTHYFMPEIARVVETDAAYGTRYWLVDTDKGPRHFAMKNPFVSIRWPHDDEMVIRDVIENVFHVSSYNGLDEHSRREIEKIT